MRIETKPMSMPPFPLPEWTPYWDPRSEKLALRDPISGSCNLPLEELEERQAELPPNGSRVYVVSKGNPHAEAIREIERRGRKAVAASPESSLENGPSSSSRLWKPSGYLENVLPQLECTGGAMDLGCGAGREALLMASWGFKVSAVDVLPDALAIGRSLEGRYLDPRAPKIAWTCLDLETGSPELGGHYGLIVCFRYLNRALLRSASALMASGGSLVAETFTESHRERHGKPRRQEFVLAPGELRDLALGLEVLDYSEDWRGEAHTARLWARKR